MNREWKNEKTVVMQAGSLFSTHRSGTLRRAGDHLGNNRVVVSATNNSSVQITQASNYYPFGLPFEETYSFGNREEQPYKFGGKEYDEMHGLRWYDFEARLKDAILPMFLTMDPMAEKYYSVSPYAYCGNNPIKFIDPDGYEIWIYYEDKNGKQQQMLYTANMKYKGNNTFVSASVKYLNYVYKNGGADVMDVLIGSSNNFNWR